MVIGACALEIVGLTMPSEKFWRGRKVFLTGHTGFKGSWIALWLHQLGATVHGYALEPESSSNSFDAFGIEEKIASSTIADIRDLPDLAAAMQRADPEIILHFAAQSLVRRSYAEPIDTFATNVMGTAHLLEAARSCRSLRAAVVVTSDKCYENHDWPWAYRENDAMGGHDPYSASKGCAELLTRSYARSFFPEQQWDSHQVAVASARAGNVIGGGDWSEDRLVPDFIRAALDGKPLIVRNPIAVRPWQHVLEPLAGYLMLAEKLVHTGPQYSGGWNFGPTDAHTRSVAWVSDRLTAIWGEGSSWVHRGEETLKEARTLRLDSGKAEQQLGWRGLWSLDEALSHTVNWAKAHRDGQDMAKFTVAQIDQFTAKLVS